jgi:hypothetical protein
MEDKYISKTAKVIAYIKAVRVFGRVISAMSNALTDSRTKLRTAADYEKSIRTEQARITNLKTQIENVKKIRSESTKNMVEQFMKSITSDLLSFDMSELRYELNGSTMDYEEEY